MKKLVLLLISLFNLIFHSQQLYVHLKMGEIKCFYDEFYSDIVVMVRFMILNKDLSLTSVSDKRLEIEVSLEGEDAVIYKHESGKMNGKFSLSIEKSKIILGIYIKLAGNYKICLYSNDRDFYSQRSHIKVSLIVDTDQDDFDEATISAKSKDFKAVDTEVRKLFKKSDNVIKIQEYQMRREDEFSENQFANNNRMIFITILQVVIITVIGIWQIFALRKVFKEKIWSPF